MSNSPYCGCSHLGTDRQREQMKGFGVCRHCENPIHQHVLDGWENE